MQALAELQAVVDAMPNPPPGAMDTMRSLEALILSQYPRPGPDWREDAAAVAKRTALHDSIVTSAKKVFGDAAVNVDNKRYVNSLPSISVALKHMWIEVAVSGTLTDKYPLGMAVVGFDAAPGMLRCASHREILKSLDVHHDLAGSEWTALGETPLAALQHCLARDDDLWDARHYTTRVRRMDDDPIHPAGIERYFWRLLAWHEAESQDYIGLYAREDAAARTIQAACHRWLYLGMTRDGKTGIRCRLDMRELQKEGLVAADASP